MPRSKRSRAARNRSSSAVTTVFKIPGARALGRSLRPKGLRPLCKNFTGGSNVIDGPYNRRRKSGETVPTSVGRADVKVGFNTTPTFGPSADFWLRIAPDGEPFFKALDYVGLDFFPDVFRPVAADGQSGDLTSSVAGILETMRSVWLPSAGIPARVPIHIAEHGWPTSADRTPDRQAEVIERVVRTVHPNRGRLNIDPGAWGLTKILLTFAYSSPIIIQQHQNH